MSRATKRKHVVRELLEERVLPAPRQRIVRVLGTPGNNLHEVETAEGTRFLASMPPRFRRHIWIKRGDFLLVDPIEEGTKVKAEMSLVLLPPHVRFLQRQGLWPEAFAPREGGGRSETRARVCDPPSPHRHACHGVAVTRPPRPCPRGSHPPAGDRDGDGELFVNTNRARPGGDTGDSEEDTGDSEEDTGDSEEDTSEEEEEEDTSGNEDAGDNERDVVDEEDAGDKERDVVDEDTGDKDTHPRDSRDKDRGDGGTRDARCPPQ
ncbi:putative RNA-binding protein EIF1AD isoform X2 [Mycteria americana]